MITTEVKQKIVEAIKLNQVKFPSNAKHAKALGIAGGIYSQILSGDLERKLSDAKWISIARKLEVNLTNTADWKIAKTAVFEYITMQLEHCKEKGLSAMFCDIPNVGKSLTAKYFAKTHTNVVYVDCSQVKSKQRLIRYIAKEFGINETGRYADVYDDLVYYIKSLEKPLIILDEAGDLKYDAFLELKALWNATEYYCGWYQMGADAFKQKLERGCEYKKVGFAEIRSRYGDRYNSIVPADAKERKAFLLQQALIVAKANAKEELDYNTIARQSGGSLRRVYSLITKSN